MPNVYALELDASMRSDAFAIVHYSQFLYYRNCYRKGYRIDFWHTNLFLLCVFPNMIMLPFAKSGTQRDRCRQVISGRR